MIEPGCGGKCEGMLETAKIPIDRVRQQLIRQWLEAGVMEDGTVQETLAGTPQGGVMTPRTQKVTWVRP